MLSVALASGKNKCTFGQDTADLSLSVLTLLCWQSCWICILMQFGGRRKILGCLPEWRNSTEQTSPPVLALPLRQALMHGASVGKVEFGQPFLLACLGDAQRVKVEDTPPLRPTAGRGLLL